MYLNRRLVYIYLFIKQPQENNIYLLTDSQLDTHHHHDKTALNYKQTKVRFVKLN